MACCGNPPFPGTTPLPGNDLICRRSIRGSGERYQPCYCTVEYELRVVAGMCEIKDEEYSNS